MLAISATTRRIVPLLRARGYEVVYREFEGGHTVPAGLAEAAMTWFAG